MYSLKSVKYKQVVIGYLRESWGVRSRTISVVPYLSKSHGREVYPIQSIKVGLGNKEHIKERE